MTEFRIREAPAVAPGTAKAPHVVDTGQPPGPPAGSPPGGPRRLRRWAGWLVALLAAALAAGALVWRAARPTPVRFVAPVQRQLQETVAISGRVGGQRETAVGAQVQGVVADLMVREGAEIRAGQPLARVQNNVVQAQVTQAEQTLLTARAQLAQAGEGARPSEVAAARARVREAQAIVEQREAQLAGARAAVRQAEARREMAQKDLARYRYLYREGAIARQRVEQAATDLRVAEAEVAAARQGVETAAANLAAARATVSAVQAEQRTLEAGPKAGGVEVARQRVRDAEQALRVAQEQAGNFLIRAPFAGTVTQIVTEVGGTVGPGGILRLVETVAPEIRMDVDESNLADLRVGQGAVITSSTFRESRFEGRVAQISPRVDPTRGTVEVTVVPENPPDWLRTGQTVNVNIITREAAPRLMVPASAVRREGDRRVVLLLRDGRAVAQPVITGPVADDLVPILEGLKPEERVVLDAEKIDPGARVTARD